MNIFSPTQLFPLGAFAMQGYLIGEALWEKGYEVNAIDIFSGEKREGDINIYMPFHYATIYNDEIIKIPLQERSKYDMSKITFNITGEATLVGISDTDKFNEQALEKIRGSNYNKFITLSRMQSEVFKMPRTTVIPAFVSYKINLFRRAVKPRENIPVVFLEAHTDYKRRGVDVALKVLDQLYAEGVKFAAILTRWNEDFKVRERPYLQVLTGFMTEAEHYGIMKSCTHFLTLLRGGAFEISTLEALALGLTVILPEGSPSAEIPLKHGDAYWVNKSEKPFDNWTNLFHVGKMREVDYESALTTTREALKSQLSFDRMKYFEEYSAKKWALEFIK